MFCLFNSYSAHGNSTNSGILHSSTAFVGCSHKKVNNPLLSSLSSLLFLLLLHVYIYLLFPSKKVLPCVLVLCMLWTQRRKDELLLNKLHINQRRNSEEKSPYMDMGSFVHSHTSLEKMCRVHCHRQEREEKNIQRR